MLSERLSRGRLGALDRVIGGRNHRAEGASYSGSGEDLYEDERGTSIDARGPILACP